MLRAALNIKWWQHIPNTDLYGDLPKVAARKMSLVCRFISHCELPAEKAYSESQDMDTEGEVNKALSWTL